MHAAWASSAALRLAGIDRATPDPEGGIIQRDADGEPTGILLENAVRLVEAVLPVPDEHDTAGAIEHALTRLWRMGITGVPCFLLEGKYAVMGAQESAVLADAIRQVAQEKASAEA